GPGRRRKRSDQRQRVRDPPHHKLVLQVVESVYVFEDQTELPHQERILEVLREGRHELCHEQRVVGRQGRDEGRIYREVVCRGMTGSARAAIAVEGLLEEELFSLSHQGRDSRTQGG